MISKVYNCEEPEGIIKKSIYLAGTNIMSPWDKIGWRDKAVKYLEEIGYSGTVFIPEDNPSDSYKYPDPIRNPDKFKKQIEWEQKWLKGADAVVFWLPRTTEKAGLISNFELGQLIETGKIFAGCPCLSNKVDTNKNGYLKNYFDLHNIPWYTDLKTLLMDAVKFIGTERMRNKEERYVPKSFWKIDSFVDWYRNLSHTDNETELKNIEPKFITIMSKENKPFFWIAQPKIWIGTEQRYKDNEFVIGRLNTSTFVVFSKDNDKDVFKNRVIFVKEFRSAVNNESGYVLEFPSGTISPGYTPCDSAIKEFEEETGIDYLVNKLNIKNCFFLNKKQVMSTLSAHTNEVWAFEISSEDMDEITKNSEGKSFGVSSDTEKTYVEILTIEDFLNSEMSDWSNNGIALALIEKIRCE